MPCILIRNPSLEDQACDRIYRVGQKRDVIIHKYTTYEPSIEMKGLFSYDLYKEGHNFDVELFISLTFHIRNQDGKYAKCMAALMTIVSKRINLYL